MPAKFVRVRDKDQFINLDSIAYVDVREGQLDVFFNSVAVDPKGQTQFLTITVTDADSIGVLNRALLSML